MVAEVKTGTPLPTILHEITESVDGFSAASKEQFFEIIAKVPMAYQKVNAIFSSPERKSPGSAHLLHLCQRSLQGLRGLCHRLRRPQRAQDGGESEEVNASTPPARLPRSTADTSQKYLGLFNAANPADSKTATLRNMLMVRTN